MDIDVPKDATKSEIDRIVKEQVFEETVTYWNWREKGKEDEED